MKLNQVFPSTYLKAEDLEMGRSYPLTINAVSMESIGRPGEEQQKPVLNFVEEDAKPLVLNRTNANTISMIAGSDDTDDWHGVVVSLYRTKATMAGKPVDAIRVDDRPSPSPANKPRPAQQAKPQLAQQRPVSNQQRAAAPAPTAQRRSPSAPPPEPPPEDLDADDISF